MTEQELAAVAARMPKKDQWGYDVGGPENVQQLAADCGALFSEVRRLQALVEPAYREGEADAYMNAKMQRDGWPDSHARKALYHP